MYKKILIAHDGFDGAQRAFDVAVILALQTPGATLNMISVEEDLPKHAVIVDQIVETKTATSANSGPTPDAARQ